MLLRKNNVFTSFLCVVCSGVLYSIFVFIFVDSRNKRTNVPWFDVVFMQLSLSFSISLLFGEIPFFSRKSSKEIANKREPWYFLFCASLLYYFTLSIPNYATQILKLPFEVATLLRSVSLAFQIMLPYILFFCGIKNHPPYDEQSIRSAWGMVFSTIFLYFSITQEPLENMRKLNIYGFVICIFSSFIATLLGALQRHVFLHYCPWEPYGRQGRVSIGGAWLISVVFYVYFYQSGFYGRPSFSGYMNLNVLSLCVCSILQTLSINNMLRIQKEDTLTLSTALSVRKFATTMILYIFTFFHTTQETKDEGVEMSTLWVSPLKQFSFFVSFLFTVFSSYIYYSNKKIVLTKRK